MRPKKADAMTKDEDLANTKIGDGGIAPMMALATEMNRNWMAMMGLGGFPSANEGGDGDGSPDAWKEVVEAQIRLTAATWKNFGDVMSGFADTAWAGQDEIATQTAYQMAEAFRAVIGMDPREMMAGNSGEWSPETVAFQSFGMVDADAAQFGTDVAQLATTSSEAARTMFDLYRVIGDAWIEAAEAFAEANVEDGAALSDPVMLQRLWVKTSEPILQRALASDAFVDANAEFIRASTRQAKARSAFARRFTDLIEAPNRQEMTETYEVIQSLRREVRSLRRNQKRLEKALAELGSKAGEE